MSGWADIPWGAAFGSMILIGLAFYLLVLIPIEGCLLKLCKWGTLVRSTIDAAVANIVLLISTFIVATNIAPLLADMSFLLGMLILWAWSVLAKGIWLTLMHRHPALQTWRTVLIVNTAIFGVAGVILAILARPRLL